jgi:plasmid stability protein
METNKEIWILYKTTNVCNGKIYVGVHKLSNTSKSKCYIGSGDALQLAVKKYGKDKFIRTTLAEFSCATDAYLAEAEMVTQEFVKREDTYNISLGGRGGVNLTEEMKAKMRASKKGQQTRLGKKHTEETKSKLRAASTGRIVSEETREKISLAGKGRKHTEETKAKMSEIAKDRPFTDEMKERIVYLASINKGRVHTTESRAKMSAFQKGKVTSEETKAKISAATMGRDVTMEARAKISAKLTGAGTPSSIPVLVNNVYYESMRLAVKLEGISKATLGKRIKSSSPDFVNYRYATEEEKLNHASSTV